MDECERRVEGSGRGSVDVLNCVGDSRVSGREDGTIDICSNVGVGRVSGLQVTEPNTCDYVSIEVERNEKLTIGTGRVEDMMDCWSGKVHWSEDQVAQ